MTQTFPEFDRLKVRVGPKWYIRFCLWFCKPIYASDVCSPVILQFKTFRGTTYLLKEIRKSDI